MASESPQEGIKPDDAVSVAATELSSIHSDLAATIQKEISHESIQPLTIHQIKPPLHEKFKGNPVKEIIRTVLDEQLNGKSYSSSDAKTWTIEVANCVNKRVKDLNMKRYKHIVQVIIGELKGAGVKCGVRCIWDSDTDGYTSEKFMNDTIFCVVAVFGVYLY